LGGLHGFGPFVSRFPLGTKVHIPRVPDRLQLLQVSVHASAQQTPSVQKPDWHSLAWPHAVPSFFLSAQVPEPQ
jgi:hypothetical protein